MFFQHIVITVGMGITMENTDIVAATDMEDMGTVMGTDTVTDTVMAMKKEKEKNQRSNIY